MNETLKDLWKYHTQKTKQNDVLATKMLNGNEKHDKNKKKTRIISGWNVKWKQKLWQKQKQKQNEVLATNMLNGSKNLWQKQNE